MTNTTGVPSISRRDKMWKKTKLPKNMRISVQAECVVTTNKTVNSKMSTQERTQKDELAEKLMC